MVVDKNIGNRMARMSFVCAMLVVFLHSYFLDLSASNDGSLAWWTQDVFSQGFCRSAVPWFFTVFAFWLFRDFEMKLAWWTRNILKRVRTIGLPYVLWGLASAIVFFAGRRLANGQWLLPEVADFGWWAHTIGIVGYPAHAFHLWFLKALLYYVMLSPVIGFAVRCFGVTVPILAFAFGVMFPDVPYWLSTGLFFVSLGCWLVQPQTTSNPTKKKLQTIYYKLESKWALVVIPLWSVLVIVKVWATKEGFCDLYGISEIGDLRVNPMMFINAIGVIALWQISRLPMLERLDGVAKSAFFIYCIQGLVKIPVIMAMLQTPILRESKLVLWFLAPAMTVFFSLMAWFACRAAVPRLCDILTGGRV